MKKIDGAEIWAQADYTKKGFTIFGLPWGEVALTFVCGAIVGLFIGMLSH